MAQIKGAENLLVYSRFSLSHLLPRCGHSTFLNLSDQVPFHLMILKGELLSVMMHERCMFLLDMKQISSLLLHCFIMRTFDVSLCAGGASAFSLMFLHVNICDFSTFWIDDISSLCGPPAFMGCIVCVGYFTMHTMCFTQWT